MTRVDAALRTAFSLAGRTAIVTGAGSGLAETIASTLALAGAGVVVAHDEADDARRVARAIREAGGTAHSVVCDPADEASVVALFDNSEVPDIVVIGAMMQGGVPAIEMTSEQWDEMFAVNLRGAFLMAREAIRRMVGDKRPGRIIALSTIGSEHPVLRGNLAYGASKAGLNQMCRSLAFEHAGDGIRVNAILPGAIPGNAPRMAGAIRSSGPGANPERHPCGFGEPADVGWLAVYLASPAAGYITGQTFVIDGGFQVA